MPIDGVQHVINEMERECSESRLSLDACKLAFWYGDITEEQHDTQVLFQRRRNEAANHALKALGELEVWS